MSADMLVSGDMSMTGDDDMSATPGDMGDMDEVDPAREIGSVEILAPNEAFDLETSERVTFELELLVRDTDDFIVEQYEPDVSVLDPIVGEVVAAEDGQYTLIAREPGTTELVVTVGGVSASLGIEVGPQVLESIRFEQSVYRFFYNPSSSVLVPVSVVALSEKGLPIEPFPENACDLDVEVGNGRVLGIFDNPLGITLLDVGISSWTARCSNDTDIEDTAMVLVERPQQLDAMRAHSCMRTSDEKIRCWGLNDHGQIGDGTRKDALAPTLISTFEDLDITPQHISTGARHTCAVSQDGDLYCWGDNRFGQVDPSSSEPYFENPTLLAPEERFVSVAAGESHSCAISIRGELSCWGTGEEGQLGLDDTTRTDSLEKVSNLRFLRLDAGATHTCAVTFDNLLYCWGDDLDEKLGNGAASGTRTPVEIGATDGSNMPVRFASVSVGEVTTCAVPVEPDGNSATSELYCWGRGDLFENGLGDTITSPPTPRTFDQPERVSWREDPMAGPPIRGVSLARDHGCALRGTKIYCWGAGNYGQLGLGDYGTGTTLAGDNALVVPSPRRLKDVAGAVNGLDSQNFFAIATGTYHSCALNETEQLACWGFAGNGRLADGKTGIEPFDGDSPSYASPVVGVAPGREHLCLHGANATVFCFGSNFYQQSLAISPPRQIVTFSGQVDGKSTSSFTPDRVYAGERFTVVLSKGANSYVFAWGANGRSQVSPVPDPTLVLPAAHNTISPNYRDMVEPVTAGYAHVCGLEKQLTGDLVLSCWGDNSIGQLGSMKSSNLIEPVVGLPDDFVTLNLDAGDDVTCVVGYSESESGGMNPDLYCWGKDVGLWGAPDVMQKNAPVPKKLASFPLPDFVQKITVGGGHACILTRSGLIQCMGRNDFHQISPDDEAMLSELTLVPQPNGMIFTDVSAGHQHTCALAQRDGDTADVPQQSVYCWGDNHLGQSGLVGDVLEDNHVLVEPTLLEPPDMDQLDPAWRPGFIEAGWATTCAMSQSNDSDINPIYQAHCWGNNSHGQAHQRKLAEYDERPPQITIYPSIVWRP